MKDLSIRGLPQLAVASGAVTPVPSNSQKGIIWSTTTNGVLIWNGTSWQPVGNTWAYEDLREVIWADFYVPYEIYHQLVTPVNNDECTFDASWADFPALVNGNIIVFNAGDEVGLWEVTDDATPSAIELTRPSGYTYASAGLKVGTKIIARKTPRTHTSLGRLIQQAVEYLPFSATAPTGPIDIHFAHSTDTVSGIDGFARIYIAKDAGATLPAGITNNTWYTLREASQNSPDWFPGALLYTEDNTTQVTWTTSGTNDGGTGLLGRIRYSPLWFNAHAILTVGTNSSYQVIPFDGSSMSFSVEYVGEYGRVALEGAAIEGVALAKGFANGVAAVAIGVDSVAYAGATAIGGAVKAEKNAFAFGASVTARPQSVGFGKAGYSHSQIAYPSPDEDATRMGTDVFQAVLRSDWVTGWPARFRSSVAYNGQAHTGMALITKSPSVLEGWCAVQFINASAEVVGSALLHITGHARLQSAPPYLALTYMVREVFSSYPGILSMTLAAYDPSHPEQALSALDVDISSTVAHTVTNVQAYLWLECRGPTSDFGPSASYVTPQVNQQYGASTAILVTASEALTAGNLVSLWSDTGTAKVRKADASDNRAADGFVLSSCSSGDKLWVYSSGEITGLSSLTVGALYLGESGAVSGTAAAAGTVQAVGFATSATTALFQRGVPILL
jgi:hypothetical protein